MIKTFPYLEIKGTHYEIGHAIGEMFRGKIQETIEERKQSIQHYAAFRAKSERYVKKTEEIFPDLIEEMRGMAQGAQIPFLDLFFHNCPEAYDKELLIEWDREQAETEEHCTIAVSFNASGAVIGHNEDWAIESLDEIYILKATVKNTTFLGLNYATFLPGSAATLNNWGLVQCINELYQETRIGIPKYFLARAICESKTLEDALKLILSIDRASGYNHLLVQGDNVWNIEIAGHDIDISKHTKTPFVHTNHCISKHMEEYQLFATKGSKARFARASELVKNNMSVEDIKMLLSDTKDEKYPICRENITIGSVIIEPKSFTMHICYGKPSSGIFIPYEL